MPNQNKLRETFSQCELSQELAFAKSSLLIRIHGALTLWERDKVYPLDLSDKYPNRKN